MPPIALSLESREATQVLGLAIRAARVRRRWTIAELAERVGVSRPTMAKIEHGDPSVAIGTVFEAARLVDVPLFDDQQTRARYGAHKQAEVALLPARARRRQVDVDDDF